MRSKKSASQKLTVVLLAVILVLCCTIGGTLAFLSAESGTVTNTFTVGKIEIELKEHELLEDGTLGAAEVNENAYKILPGATQNKDPFVRVKVGSEKCYVYVCIENQLGANLTYNIGNEWAEVGNRIADSGLSGRIVFFGKPNGGNVSRRGDWRKARSQESGCE